MMLHAIITIADANSHYDSRGQLTSLRTCMWICMRKLMLFRFIIL